MIFSADLDRRAEELPYQLVQIGNIEGLKAVLVEQDMFVRLYTPSFKQNLLDYWLHAGGYPVAADSSLHALNAHLKKHAATLTSEAKLNLQTKMLNFLIDIGQYSQAETLLEKLIKDVSNEFGKDSRQMCDPLFSAVVLFFLQGIKVVYSSDPVYQRCSKIGGKYARECARLHKVHFDKNDLHLGRVLTKCGYFVRDYLQEAKAIVMERSKQDYAEILYNLGEKHQYEEISIPINYFKESLKLCLSHFGQYHLSTARCYQLYGQVFWNQYDGSKKSMMENCLGHYSKELEILEILLGAHHPTTVRSREDVIIILQTLKRNDEAAKLQKFQP